MPYEININDMIVQHQQQNEEYRIKILENDGVIEMLTQLTQNFKIGVIRQNELRGCTQINTEANLKHVHNKKCNLKDEIVRLNGVEKFYQELLNNGIKYIDVEHNEIDINEQYQSIIDEAI